MPWCDLNEVVRLSQGLLAWLPENPNLTFNFNFLQTCCQFTTTPVPSPCQPWLGKWKASSDCFPSDAEMVTFDVFFFILMKIFLHCWDGHLVTSGAGQRGHSLNLKQGRMYAVEKRNPTTRIRNSSSSSVRHKKSGSSGAGYFEKAKVVHPIYGEVSTCSVSAGLGLIAPWKHRGRLLDLLAGTSWWRKHS